MASLKLFNKSSTGSQRNVSNTRSVLEKLKSLSRRTVSRAENPLDGLSPPKSSNSSNSYNYSNPSAFSESQNETWELIKKILRYFFAFLLFAFIILNILAALKILPNFLAELFRPILMFFGYNIGETVRQISDVSDEGTKALSGAISKTADTGVDFLEEASKLNPDAAAVALSNATNKYNKPDEEPVNEEPEPIETDNRSQRAGSNKSGYCYIGEDRGFRSCIKVSEHDSCMSGDIFPTEAICINPSLRP